MTAVIRVDDAMRHQVGLTSNGIDFRPDGDPFKRPREAIEYARRINGEAPRPGQSDLAGPGGPTSRDAAGQPEAPGPKLAASLSVGPCEGCGGPLPAARRGQRRLTCSDRCRRAAARRAAANATGADTDGGTAVVTPSRAAEAVMPDPTSLESAGGYALPADSKDAGPDLSPGHHPPDVLALGL